MTNRNAAGKFTRKATITDVEAKMPEEKRLLDQLQSSAQSLWESLSMGYSNLTSNPVGRTWTILIFRVGLYALGIVGTLYAVAALSLMLQAGGWPLFLIAVLEIMTIILGCIASWTLSDKVVNYIAAGRLTDDIATGAGWLKARFTHASTTIKSKITRTANGATVH